jgi:amino acid adenylation domain-containing protein
MTGRTAPASLPQRRLWFLDKLEPGSTAYHVPIAVRLTGDLDVGALELALAAVVTRHEVLRTRFETVRAEPVQRVDPPPTVGVSIPVVEAVGEAAMDTAIEAAARRPFDLAAGPLIRAELVRQAPAEHVLVVTAHHIVMDGWSLGVLFRELSAQYSARTGGPVVDQTELPLQYGDFARWQIDRRDSGALDGLAAWWKDELAGAPDVLELPTAFPRGRRSSGAAGVARLRLGESLADDVAELALATNSTLYMTLLAAFQLLLGRLAGAGEVVVGSPVAGRIRPEIEPLIGCFINTLPIRTDLTGSPGFRDLVGRVRTASLRAFEHEELSFEAIVDVVKPDRSATETPIFQALFTVDQGSSPVTRTGVLLWQFMPVRRERVKYDVTVTVTRPGEDLEISLEYRSDLFDADWARSFLSRFRSLLSAAVLNPDLPVDRLPLLTRAERAELVSGRNQTARPYDLDTPVTELFARQVQATPDAEAVVFDGTRLTYAELEHRSAAVAARLQELGVTAGDRVGLCLLRSTDLVVGIYGVLRAGAAYLPLDPSLPPERLDFMLQDSGARVVLTHEPTRAAVPAAAVALDVEADLLAVTAGVSVGLQKVSATDTAYVIYTSGSTGKPKGVLTSHRSLVNRLLWMQEQFVLDDTDTVLQKTPFSFDVSVWEFLWPLIVGARLVVARPDGHRNPAYLARVIRDERVTTVHFVPSMLQVFTEVADLTALPSLRRIVCSGEALPAELVRRVHASGTAADLHNLYGPTEAAIDVSHWWCDPADDGAAGVPIGRPIANTQLYVVDAQGEPVPDGVCGELVIGGVQVSGGYLNRPELTVDRFIEDGFTGSGSLYRTGDLARSRQDGAIEFLGRLDHQVKLRGFRIELGEIEAALREQAGVRDAVVVVIGERLVGYVAAGEQPDDAAIRGALAARLPEYMVPAVLVRLAELPLSPNGKVDRRALPEPPSARGTGIRVAPRDGLELDLVSLWEDLLGTAPIGVTDDFFGLGGNSLQVIRMLGLVSERHGTEVPVTTMFTGAATIEALAARLREGDTTGWSPVVPFRATGSRPPLFCLPPAVGNVLSYVDLARRLDAEQPVYGLQALGLDAGQEPVANLDDVTTRFVAAIREVQPAGPYRLIGYCVGSVFAYAVARRLLDEGDDIALLAVLDGGPPNLDNGFEDADEADIAAWFGWELGRSANRRLQIDADELRGHTGERLATEVVRRAIEADVLPPDTVQAQLSRLLATFTAGVRAAREHPDVPLPRRILGLMAAEENQETNPVQRWAPLAGGGLDLVEVPGDHYSMMRPPHVDAVVKILEHELHVDERGDS